MSPFTSILRAALVLALFSCFAPLHAQVVCPNVCASHINSDSVEIGPIDDCSIDLTIFGVHIRATGPKCPAELDVYPGHGECRGVHAAGTDCAFSQTLPINRLKCECTYGFLFSHFFKPRCECDYSGTAGTFDDFHTVPCVSST